MCWVGALQGAGGEPVLLVAACTAVSCPQIRSGRGASKEKHGWGQGQHGEEHGACRDVVFATLSYTKVAMLATVKFLPSTSARESYSRHEWPRQGVQEQAGGGQR